MKKVICIVMIAAMMTASMACVNKKGSSPAEGENETPTSSMSGLSPTPSSSNQTTEQPIANFNQYTQHFGKSLAEVREIYSGSSELQYLDGWLGASWYELDDDTIFAFDGVSIEEVDSGADKTATMHGVQTPLGDIYPKLEYLADANGIISKEKFEEYIGLKTEFYQPGEEDEFSTCFLRYEQENLSILVFCDENKEIHFYESFCQFNDY